MFSDAPTTGPYAPPCGSRCFEGVARGSMIGAAWTFAYGADEAPKGRAFGTTLARNCFGFASFLGVYSAVTCAAEKARRRDDGLNNFLGGCAAGAFAAVESPTVRAALGTSLATGMVCALFYMAFKPRTREENWSL
ncbi:hypothetical protein CTAYLR_000437 [Chrysophaeum taylorii]|uniref:NADH dehydrogenase [ubiquinone] 1 alpha subcomplex subunit 11 n=1 Tax=Chrysophaeum taylorii TaxID=2483200 RepID=A0AAD7UHS6_9STRA|nr:hypothetical protein CTAYLR_000437 [Chrysophaeum taylorii]